MNYFHFLHKYIVFWYMNSAFWINLKICWESSVFLFSFNCEELCDVTSIMALCQDLLKVEWVHLFLKVSMCYVGYPCGKCSTWQIECFKALTLPAWKMQACRHRVQLEIGGKARLPFSMDNCWSLSSTLFELTFII